jgi:hypothetical protein
LQTVQRYVKVKNSKLVDWQNKVGEDHPPAADDTLPKAA